MKHGDVNLREVLFEFYHTGSRSIRVVAIDPVSGTEVTMVGDARQGEERLKQVAARKLAYVIAKKREQQ